MKQHITEQQLHELSKKGKERLRKWWSPKIGDWWFYDHEAQLLTANSQLLIDTKEGVYPVIQQSKYGLMYISKTKPAYPLLSIGQMIEFLKENYNEVSTWTNDLGKSGVDCWIRGKNIDNEISKSYDSKELCDALWEAIKEKLEK